MEPVPSLRPRTVGELLDGSFVLYRRHFGKLLLVATLVSLPALVVAGVTAEESTAVLSNVLYDTLESARRNQGNLLQHLRDSLQSAEGLERLSVISALIQAVSRGGAAAAMAVVVGAVAAGQAPPGWWQILRRSLPRMHAAILAQAILGLLTGVFCCCLPLGILANVISMPFAAIAVLERGRVETRVTNALTGRGTPGWLASLLAAPAVLVDATARCFALSWHPMTIGRGTIYVGFLMLFVSVFVSAVSVALALLIDSVAAVYWVQHYAEVLFLPISGIGAALWYIDLRVRREALDLLPAETFA